jgi:cytochrome b6-f complex iron-sulfur subunit
MSPCGRRTFLAATLRAGVAAGCGPLLLTVGCNGEQAGGAPESRVALASLADGARLRVEADGRPVELLRRDGTVTARSLLCTHQGCEVAWHEAEEAYVCPCHDGRFDDEGRPLYGPPRLPLREVTVSIEGDEIVIGS